jgi:glycine/D-amino acid oxidase-like deaminating enzyme
MRIAIAFRLPPELEVLLVDDNVLYRPDLQIKGPHAMQAMLSTGQPDVLILRSLPNTDVLAAWRAAISKDRPLGIIQLAEGSANLARQEMPNGIELHQIDISTTLQPEIDALLLAESANLRHLATRSRIGARDTASSRDIAMVGCGIVNLVTAYYLVREGYRVAAYDTGPDPSLAYDWHQHGCTFGGSDARIFSLNEGRHHHHKGYTITQETNTQFQRSIADDGWLSLARAEHSEADCRWIQRFERVPQWLSGRFDKDIISFNRESLGLWRRMMSESPELFLDIGFHDGLLRLYATPQKFDRARQSEKSIGAVLYEIDPQVLAEQFPSLQEGVHAGRVAGALAVEGFSLNIHKLGRALVSYLERMGAAFYWNTKVDGVARDNVGRVTGLKIGPETVTASHYILSAGAFCKSLLEGFASHTKVAPVVGMWITLPDTAPRLDRPLKISRSGYASAGAAEGANVIAGTDATGRNVIHISSGHGYIGIDAKRPDPEAMADLARAVHETAQHFFPSKYNLAREMGMIPKFDRYCIRPWTTSGLGLFETAEAHDDGLAIVTGGHNTGGFAQAPSVAQAVVAAFRGKDHPMHTLYHPRRFSDFIQCGEAAEIKCTG